MADPSFALLSELPEYALLAEPGVSLSPEITGFGDLAYDAEARRTELSDACLREAWHGRQQRLAGLTREQFRELHQFVRSVLPDRASLQSARYMVAVHDVGKNPRLRRAVGADPHEDHDAILAALIGDDRHTAARRALLPTFGHFSAGHRAMIREVCRWPLGYTKLVQGEAPAGYLAAVERRLGETARDHDIIKSIMDIAGARGHHGEVVSTTLTAEFWPRVRALNHALRERGAGGTVQRFDAFLDGEFERLSPTWPGAPLPGPRERRALTRLALHLRITGHPGFARLGEAFWAVPEPVRAILIEELNRDGIARRATLPVYGPALMLRTAAVATMETALTFYAHVLQEAHIADRRARLTGAGGLVVADLESLAGSSQPHTSEVRFDEDDVVLRPRVVVPRRGDPFPEAPFGNLLTGAVAVIVGMGGGSDCVQAAALRMLLKHRYGLRDAVVVSVRRPENRVRGELRRVGSATFEIGADTRAVGSWRFLEDVPLEGDDPARTLLLHDLGREAIRAELAAIVAAAGAGVVIGVDTGGDSLYYDRADVTDRAAASPDQDHRVLTALAALAEDNPELAVFSAVVAPGVDSPPYANEVLTLAGAHCIDPSESETEDLQNRYATWRMNGSDPHRYGKTPLAWLAALRGERGLRVLDLPASNVTSDENPWRCFLDIDPGMRRIMIMEARRHSASIARPGTGRFRSPAARASRVGQSDPEDNRRSS